MRQGWLLWDNSQLSASYQPAFLAVRARNSQLSASADFSMIFMMRKSGTGWPGEVIRSNRARATVSGRF